MALDYLSAIKESIKTEKLAKSRQRRKEVEELLNFYTGTNTENYIKDFYIYQVNVSAFAKI